MEYISKSFQIFFNILFVKYQINYHQKNQFFYHSQLLMMQEKTFFLENQQTSQSELIKWEIPTLGSYVNLQKLFETIPSPHKKIFKIFNPEKDSYIQFTRNTPNSNSFHSNPYTISRQLLKLNILIIKYTNNPDYPDSEEQSDPGDQNKKQRSGQRNIRQVIQLVQKWRQYHDNPADGKKKTLQQAAKIVGISKKSLDDYYYQLRVGQKHQFDFNAHLEQKIGVLRAFIKSKQPQRKIEGKNAKHPKKLKIIQQFTEKLRITDSPISPPPYSYTSSSFSFVAKNNQLSKSQQKILNSPYPSQSIIQLNQDQLFWDAPNTPLSQQKFIDFQRNFYNDFDFGLEDIGDPYLPFLGLQEMVSKKSQSSDKF